MSRHTAADAALGDLYQFERALLELVRRSKEEPALGVSIELFDDVAFEEEGGPLNSCKSSITFERGERYLMPVMTQMRGEVIAGFDTPDNHVERALVVYALGARLELLRDVGLSRSLWHEATSPRAVDDQDVSKRHPLEFPAWIRRKHPEDIVSNFLLKTIHQVVHRQRRRYPSVPGVWRT